MKTTLVLQGLVMVISISLCDIADAHIDGVSCSDQNISIDCSKVPSNGNVVKDTCIIDLNKDYKITFLNINPASDAIIFQTINAAIVGNFGKEFINAHLTANNFVLKIHDKKFDLLPDGT